MTARVRRDGHHPERVGSNGLQVQEFPHAALSPLKKVLRDYPAE
jgi:hypothetical protein